MWEIVFSVLIITNFGSMEGKPTWGKQFDTQIECTAYATAHEARFADFIRGHKNLSFEVPVLVSGKCREVTEPEKKPEGQPA